MFQRLLLFSFLSLSLIVTKAQDKVIRLYEGAAPGSESWTWDEAENDDNAWKTKAVYNVSKPTLTVFEPSQRSATGTAIIICPGGAFHALSINNEGYDVAKWLANKGVTCFVLKYRLAHSITTDPVKEMTEKWGKKEFNDENRAVIPLCIADGKAAIAYVRAHAKEYNINPDKIGIAGFSAGGTVATAAAFNYTPETKPNFVAPVYPFFPNEMMDSIPQDAPPMFIVAATDDGLKLGPHSTNLYEKWVAANHPAEIHMYSTGNHGFGMRVQHLPSDTWIDRFGDWLKVNGYLKLQNPPDWMKDLTDAQLDEMRKKDEERQRNDWANLTRYKEENEQTAKTTSTKPRVVFMGNSITEGWKNADAGFFAADKNYHDRGISGQTTPQMILRFRQDVIELKPAVVVILAGINDIAQNTGPMTLEQTFGNIVTMAELAKANNIKVVLSSVLPAYDFPWRPGLAPADKVIKLNSMLKSYAAKNNIVYLDYFTAMKDARNGLKEELTYDGVHPTLAGYKVMEPLAEKAIADAIKRK